MQESAEFHKRSFECAIDSIRAIAASHLWQLVVVRADLNGHLKALKDYFLLAKGDFFQVRMFNNYRLIAPFCVSRTYIFRRFPLNTCEHVGCFLIRHDLLCQCFLEESRQLMRLPPRQSTAEADLMVPFQLVRLL